MAKGLHKAPVAERLDEQQAMRPWLVRIEFREHPGGGVDVLQVVRLDARAEVEQSRSAVGRVLLQTPGESGLGGFPVVESVGGEPVAEEIDDMGCLAAAKFSAGSGGNRPPFGFDRRLHQPPKLTRINLPEGLIELVVEQVKSLLRQPVHDEQG